MRSRFIEKGGMSFLTLLHPNSYIGGSGGDQDSALLKQSYAGRGAQRFVSIASKLLVGRVGIEPTTKGLKGLCSTN